MNVFILLPVKKQHKKEIAAVFFVVYVAESFPFLKGIKKILFIDFPISAPL